MRRFVLSLIIGLLSVSCLFSCADDGAGDTADTVETTSAVETTALGDNKPDKPDTNVEYQTFVDEEIKGFSVKGEKYYYEYNDEDFLIFDVENLTDKVQTVEIAVIFYDKNGNEVAKEAEYFPDLPAGDTQSFIFRTTEKFAGFTYELDAEEYTSKPVFGEFNFDINGLRRIDITDTVTGNKVPSLCADISCGINENAIYSLNYISNIVIFDDEGTVQSLSSMYHYVSGGQTEKTMFLRKIPENYDIPLDGLNAKVILSEINYRYTREENQSEITNETSDDIIKNYDTEKMFDNGFSVKEKKYMLDGKDILLFSVENPTDINYGITITVKYFDESGAQIKKQVQSYDWYCANYQKYFLFRPGKTFDSYTYEIEFAKTGEDVPRVSVDTGEVLHKGGYTVLEGNDVVVLPIPNFVTYVENKSDYNVNFVYCGMIFDDKGELYDIIDTGMWGISYANNKNRYSLPFYSFDKKRPTSLDEVADRFDGQAKALMILMDVEIWENMDEIYG